jgi:predicted RNase H-like nuclease
MESGTDRHSTQPGQCQQSRNSRTAPLNAYQNMLNSVFCCFMGYRWLIAPRADSILIGDLQSGYMVAPTEAGTRNRLTAAAAEHGVPEPDFTA